MRFETLLAGLALSLPLCAGPAPTLAGEPDGAPRPSPLEIHVTGGDWGNAPPKNIERVCHSAAMELWRYFPGRRLHPIHVTRSHNGPIVLYDRLSEGQFQVRVENVSKDAPVAIHLLLGFPI